MSTSRDSPVDRVVETVSSWSGITTGEGRFGSTTFELAGREIGHVHGSGAVDIGYPTAVRDRLVADGLTGEHHVVPNSNATTFRLESAEGVERAVTLLRLSYLYRVSVLQTGSAGVEEVEDVDVGSELRTLPVTDGVRDVFLETVGSR